MKSDEMKLTKMKPLNSAKRRTKVENALASCLLIVSAMCVLCGFSAKEPNSPQPAADGTCAARAQADSAENARTAETSGRKDQSRMMKSEELQLTQEWDKVFPKSEDVDHCKVTFVNHFGITLAADMYIPKNAAGKLPAVAVCGPFGACKEQSSGLYAQEMAKRGFLAIAFDPSFTGESGGYPRAMHSPDINVEDFQAAVDFLSCHEKADPDKIGIIGICGWGGMALQTACVDTRIKAAVTSTMYDMSRVAGNGYFDANNNKESRQAARKAINKQRTEDFRSGAYARQGGVVDPLPQDAPFFVKDYYDYYKTPRGYHKRSLNSNDGWNVTAGTSLMNTRLFAYAGEIDSAVMLIHGEKAHSCYMSRDAFKLLKGDNKELVIIPGAVHTDLYDGGGKNAIPFDKIESFLRKHLQADASARP